MENREKAQTAEKIVYEGLTFHHIKTRAYTPVSIYRSDDGTKVLRRGPADLLQQELAKHKELLGLGFPLSAILSEKEEGGTFSYIEESFGDELLADLFAKDFKETGEVSNEHFSSLLSVTEQFAQAQLGTAAEGGSDEGLRQGVHVEWLQEELPELAEDIQRAFEKASQRVSVLPTVATHGDLNPRNMFEKGVIDFGDTFEAPYGYDLVTVLYNVYNFPKVEGYEMQRRYEFDEERRRSYFEAMDDLSKSQNLPDVSGCIDDFVMLRTIWSCVRMQNYPKIQAWRYERFGRMLNAYLNGESVQDIAFV